MDTCVKRVRGRQREIYHVKARKYEPPGMHSIGDLEERVRLHVCGCVHLCMNRERTVLLHGRAWRARTVYTRATTCARADANERAEPQ
jgi:hypothetical protein